MNELLFRETPFRAYGPSHWVVLILLALAASVLVALARRWRATPKARFLRRAFAWTMLAVLLPLQAYQAFPENWDVGLSLPFELCDLAWIAAVVTLFRGGGWTFGPTYYWGLTLTMQGLLTPHLPNDFPHLQFLMFFASHCLTVLAAIYLTWGVGLRPDWRLYRSTLAITIGWGALMLAFNSAFGTNYLYVNRKPPTASLLDLFGPWPWYLAVELAFGMTLWALLTLPWTGRRTGD